MPTISLLLITVRDDYPIIGMPKTHIFEPLINSLNKQKFKDFELIIVDSLFESRNKSPFEDANFPIKHVPPKSSPWLKVGMLHAANNVNTGLLFVEGELVVRVDDCEEFVSPKHLNRIWYWYNRGFYPQQTYIYYYKNRPAKYSKQFEQEVLEKGNFWGVEKEKRQRNWKVFQEGEIIRDTRFRETPENTKLVPPEWHYGLCTVSLQDALKLNGLDQNFDGFNGLVDCDFGSRLQMNGSPPFLFDKELLVIEHLHGDMSGKIVKQHIPFKNNLALYNLNRQHHRVKANSVKLTETDIEYVKTMTEDPKWGYQYSAKWFTYWIENQQIFDLNEMRLNL